MEKYQNLIEQLKTSMTIDGIVHIRFYHSLEVAKIIDIGFRVDFPVTVGGGLEPADHESF